MTARRRRIWLAILSVGMLMIAMLFFATPAARRSGKPPRDVAGRARWLASHPARWYVAAQISETALESTLPRRVELWRASHEHALRLAPRRPNAGAAFVRGGLFHWYELGSADRAAVLENAEPMLRDPLLFRDMAYPLWRLTGDFALLRRATDRNLDGLTQLSRIAATHGLFAEYRELRSAVRRRRLDDFRAHRAAGRPPAEWIDRLPLRLDVDDRPVVEELLDALHVRPMVQRPERADVVDSLVTFALRHDLQPFDGLEVLLRLPHAASDVTRARLALRLGKADRANEIRATSNIVDKTQWEEFERERARAANAGVDAEWKSACGAPVVCGSATRRLRANTPTALQLTVAPAQSDEVPPYVELFVNDRRVAEADVRAERTLTFNLPAGDHRLELVIANPSTRNRIQRRVRLSSDW